MFGSKRANIQDYSTAEEDVYSECVNVQVCVCACMLGSACVKDGGARARGDGWMGGS